MVNVQEGVADLRKVARYQRYIQMSAWLMSRKEWQIQGK